MCMYVCIVLYRDFQHTTTSATLNLTTTTTTTTTTTCTTTTTTTTTTTILDGIWSFKCTYGEFSPTNSDS